MRLDRPNQLEMAYRIDFSAHALAGSTSTACLQQIKSNRQVLRDPSVRQNEAYMTIIVLSRVITRLGTLNDVNPGVVENIFSADLDYLQSLYRQINEAGDTSVPAVCPDCGRGFDVHGIAPTGES